MRFAKIAEGVAIVTARRKELTDKEAVYPETMWPIGHFDELIRRGFLVEVNEVKRKVSFPERDTKVTKAPEEPKKKSSKGK